MRSYSTTTTTTIHTDGGDHVVRLYERSGGHSTNSQDSSLATVVDGSLRIAAIDGVTPTARTRRVHGADGAMWAAGVARTLLAGSSGDLETVLDAINDALFDDGLENSRDQQQVAVVAADIPVRPADGAPISIVRSADCLAWVRSAGEWRQVFDEEIYVPDVRRRVDAWLAQAEQRYGEPRFAMEEAVSGSPHHWLTTALGRFRIPRLQSVVIAGATEVLLASDGARVHGDDPPRALTEQPPTGPDCTIVHLVLDGRRGART